MLDDNRKKAQRSSCGVDRTRDCRFIKKKEEKKFGKKGKRRNLSGEVEFRVYDIEKMEEDGEEEDEEERKICPKKIL